MQYDKCYTPQCTRRSTCTLWHNALECIEEGAIQVTITSPRIIEEAGGYDHCPLYYEHKLRHFARGLIWTYPEMTVAQLEHLHRELTARFGYNNVVRMRCGYEAISPEEQDAIAEIFEALAPGHLPQYKRFEEHYTKPPRVEGRAAHKFLGD